ncbi:MAG: pyruvate ferredoxin oxidoreductase, partial [Desulfobacteraceae bacterium]|nr:pyruvate ferredoxin oxidoreductase [Desulfobacteraceae bacterium]
LRGTNAALRDGGTLIYYNTAWQPLEVRLNLAEPVGGALISKECQKRNIREISVFKADLKDARMQNIVLLANIDKYSLIPGIKKEHYIQAMDDLLQGRLLETNIELFEKERI